MSSKKWRALPVLSAAALVLVMAACGSSGGGSSSSGSTKTKTIGVILPDTTTSPRWEANDRPSLNAAFTAAGFKGDIQNAGGDKTKFSTICQSMINEGVSVLMIVNLDSDSGGSCLKKDPTIQVAVTLQLGGWESSSLNVRPSSGPRCQVFQVSCHLFERPAPSCIVSRHSS